MPGNHTWMLLSEFITPPQAEMPYSLRFERYLNLPTVALDFSLYCRRLRFTSWQLFNQCRAWCMKQGFMELPPTEHVYPLFVYNEEERGDFLGLHEVTLPVITSLPDFFVVLQRWRIRGVCSGCRNPNITHTCINCFVPTNWEGHSVCKDCFIEWNKIEGPVRGGHRIVTITDRRYHKRFRQNVLWLMARQ